MQQEPKNINKITKYRAKEQNKRKLFILKGITNMPIILSMYLPNSTLLPENV